MLFAPALAATAFVRHRLKASLVILLPAFSVLVPGTGQGRAPELQSPLDCPLGTRNGCFIQYFFDHGPGSSVQDPFCGPMARNEGRGTAFALRSFTRMKEGVPVLAAAAGRVMAVRTGMENRDFRHLSAADIQGREGGNGLVIDHGDGWQTWYNHMRGDGIRLQPGDTVSAGQRLGYAGLSGRATFPQLYFILRHNGVEIDPFTGAEKAEGCEKARTSMDQGYWTALTRAAMLPSEGAATGPGLVGAGFVPARLSRGLMEQGWGETVPIPTRAPALLFWVESFGIQAGDEAEFVFSYPDGRELARKVRKFKQPFARNLTYIGRQPPAGGWPAGQYPAHFVLRRNGVEILRLDKTAKVEIQDKPD